MHNLLLHPFLHFFCDVYILLVHTVGSYISHSIMLLCLLFCFQGKMEVAPRFGNVLGGTPIVVTVEEDCLQEDYEIMCSFAGKSTEGVYVDSRRAVCPSPPMRRTGYVPFDFSVSNGTTTIYHGGSRYQACKGK